MAHSCRALLLGTVRTIVSPTGIDEKGRDPHSEDRGPVVRYLNG